MKLKLQKITLENDGIFSIKLDPEVNFPEHLFDNNYTDTPDLQIANYEAYKLVSKNKINLNKNVFSFLLDGQKDIHFSNDIVSIDDTQSLLLASGNFLTTEIVGANSVVLKNILEL